MRNKQNWFNEKVSSVSPEIRTEIQLSANIIARIDSILKEKNMSQRDLARKLGKSEAVCKKQVFDQQFSEKLVSADFGKQLLHILIDKAVMRQRAAASLLGA